MNDRWKNPDVHANTLTIQRIMSEEHPELPRKSREILQNTSLVQLVLFRIKSVVTPSVIPFIEKIERRQGMNDRDLLNINGLGLLILIWLKMEEIKYDMDTIKALNDTLLDINMTCLQGDTHRLYCLYIALDRSKKCNY
jgi:hypothetical protein